MLVVVAEDEAVERRQSVTATLALSVLWSVNRSSTPKRRSSASTSELRQTQRTPISIQRRIGPTIDV